MMLANGLQVVIGCRVCMAMISQKTPEGRAERMTNP
jgi:hypothetical protein